MEQSKSGERGKILRALNRLLVWSARIIEEDNEAIWSIPKPFKRIYSFAMAAICGPLLVDIVIEEISAIKPAGWWANITTIAGESATDFAPIGIGVGIALLIIAHIGAVIVSLYHMIANRWVKPVVEEHIAQGREEGRAEGRAEALAEVRAWLQRKVDAEAKGLPFDEPPPGIDP